MQITSHRNPKVKHLRSLKLRKYRWQSRSYLVEGIRIVEDALVRGALVETLVYSPDLLVSARAQALVQQSAATRHLIVSESVFRSLSQRDDPQGIAAVVHIEESSLNEIAIADDTLLLVAHALRDPGNLGSIVRTADAVGATGLVVVEPTVDLYDPQAVRATMGSLFALPIFRVPGEGALVDWLSEVRAASPPLFVVGTSARGEETYDTVDYCRPLVLLVGSESHGLPATVRSVADVNVRLSMMGGASSINVSAAAAVLLYEVLRQRQTAASSSANV